MFNFVLKDDSQVTYVHDENKSLDSYSVYDGSIIYLE
jgi:hypothetical protein